MVKANNHNGNASAAQLIDINVIFEIYDETGADIINFALGAFKREASKYPSQLVMAMSEQDQAETRRLFHSLKTMAAMVGISSLAELCAELEQLDLSSDDFPAKYQAFLTLWLAVCNELEQYLGY